MLEAVLFAYLMYCTLLKQCQSRTMGIRANGSAVDFYLSNTEIFLALLLVVA